MASLSPEGKLDRLWKRGCDFLGTRTAILGGAMSWLSERHLVSAISNADKPFGVNLITMHPDLDALIDVCIARKIGHIVLAGGVPTASSIAKIKETGAKTICFAPALVLAKRLVRNGADALVIEGAEAGGHIGPVATSVLAQEILPVMKDVPVFVAGGIARGEAVVSYLEMGAAGCQLGTRFVCATESIAHADFKKAFIRANARDAVPTVQIDPKFPVIPVRALVNEGTKRFMETQRAIIGKFQKGDLTQKEAQLEIEHYWAGALKRAVIDGDVENGSLMAGQSVGMVTKEQPIGEILDEIVSQAVSVLAERGYAESS